MGNIGLDLCVLICRRGAGTLRKISFWDGFERFSSFFKTHDKATARTRTAPTTPTRAHSRREQVGSVLVVRRRDNGKLACIGGFVEVGETLEEATRREVREETGLEVTSLQMLPRVSPYSEPPFWIAIPCFLQNVGVLGFCTYVFRRRVCVWGQSVRSFIDEMGSIRMFALLNYCADFVFRGRVRRTEVFREKQR